MQASHWTSHAGQWRHIGPPLRPCAEDVAYLRDRVAPHLDRARPARLLLLGVTPEIATLSWPFGLEVDLLAVDQSKSMIEQVWPGDGPRRRALLGDWRDLPIEPGSIDLAVGDGCFTIFDFPAGYRELSASIARALRPGGLLSIRLYARLEDAEPLERVFDDLFSNRIGNFHVFKWRLAMALQGDSPSQSVRLSEVWTAFEERVPDQRALAERTGWPLDEVLTINAYRDATSSYSFPSSARVIAAVSQDFELIDEWRGSYELAERCPQLLLRRR